VIGGPGVRPVSSEEAWQTLERARYLRWIGERDAAVATLRKLHGHPDPTISAEAEYATALLRLELGYPVEAAAVLGNLLGREAAPHNANRAAFLLAVARRQAGDCQGSVAALFDYGTRSDLLAPYVGLQLSLCYQRLGDADAALTQTEGTLQVGGPRLLRIDALERQAAILESAGDLAGALHRHEQLIELARDRNYKTDIRLKAAGLNEQLGRASQTVAHLVAVVSEAPGARRAASALDQLMALGGQDEISYFQAGVVRFFSGNYTAAQRNFEGALAARGEAANHPAAAYYRAVSRVRQGEELDGASDLLALPGRFPASRFAPDALLRAGKILESNGRFTQAAEAYRRAAYDYPASGEASESLFRLGLANLMRSAPTQARSAWSTLGPSGASTQLRALALLWLGKLESQLGDAQAAAAHWRHAADLAPGWYGGMRSRGLLEGSLNGPGASLDPARVEIGAEDLAELDSWTSARGAELNVLAAELAADTGLARADELLAIGLGAEAGWEFDELSARRAGDPARLAVLSLALQERGLANAALRQAQAALEAARVGSREAPIALQKLLYPLPYVEVFQAQGGRWGVDPLLLGALVRQESVFDPRARSSANAVGLTQVIPSTAREIAAALGRRDFNLEELHNPSTSLEFGAFYLGQRLRRHGGALFPALAAYNAGDGPVDRWVRDYGLEDIDLFAERIPYAETNHYVRIVFENYGLYRTLYGGLGTRVIGLRAFQS
jgi:soluble lytic murein transglycosylase